MNNHSKASFLKKRYRATRRFHIYGILSVTFALSMLVLLLAGITNLSFSAFTQHYIKLDVTFVPERSDSIEFENDMGDNQEEVSYNFNALAKRAIYNYFPEVTTRKNKKLLKKILSSGADYQLHDIFDDKKFLAGSTHSVFLLVSDDVDLFLKNDSGKNTTLLSRQQMEWVNHLKVEGVIKRKFAKLLFTGKDSREPELAGLKGAIIGSFLTILVTLALSFPVGVMSAIYLEEFSPKNKFTDFIEVNINNLAAVPSIVFGLLGLAVFIGFFNLPRSAPIVGGIVLALMTMPTIIIATRASLKSVPDSIRQAAFGLGASHLQVVLHHVLPSAMPGILTGTIIGIAQAAGETAPLLLIGMMAFVADVPQGFTEKATVLPAQIFMWANHPERAFEAKTAAAIVVLLIFLFLMNAVAIYLRRYYEKKG